MTCDHHKRHHLRRHHLYHHHRHHVQASVGWPSSELYHYQISQSVGLEDILAEGGRAPSVLNGVAKRC
jgi:hypothetical protein